MQVFWISMVRGLQTYFLKAGVMYAIVVSRERRKIQRAGRGR
jgi:hypothetical protein